MRHRIYSMIMESTALVYLMVFVDPYLLIVCVCVRVHVCAPMFLHEGTGRGQRGRAAVNAGCLPQSLSAPFFDKGSFTKPEACLYGQAGWPASPKDLSPPPQCWDYRCALVCQFLTWILAVYKWVLVYAPQAHDCLNHLSRPTSHVPPEAFKN